MLIRTKLGVLGVALAAAFSLLGATLVWSRLEDVQLRRSAEDALARSRACVELAAASSEFLAQLHREPAGELGPASARLLAGVSRVEAALGAREADARELRALIAALRDDPPAPDDHRRLAGRARELQGHVGRLTAAVFEEVERLEAEGEVGRARLWGRVQQASLAAGALCALALAAGALLLLPRVRHGLAALHAGAERIRSGDLSQPVGLAGRDELGLLARAFDGMAAELRQTVVSRDHLEATVTERTAALEASRAELARRVAQLESTRSRLDAADRLAAVGRLSRGLTHELNNPLAIVQANLEYVREEELESGDAPGRRAERLEALDEALTASRRMTQIVKDLAAFSREPGNDQGPADLAGVLEYVRRLVGPNFRERLRLELTLPAGPLPVRGSTSALGSLFSRLVLDAVAAYPPGTPAGKARVAVDARREASDVVVEVHDSGEPIPPDLLPHVFDPFFTATPGFTAGQGGRGVGVGLAACYGLVEGVGGTIAVESAAGTGTTFRVRLRAAGSDTRFALRGAAAAPRARRRVLAVHEDPLTLAGVYRVLAARFDVVPHPSARHALTLLEARERFDALVCDAALRELDAATFHDAVAALRPELARGTVFLHGEGGLPGALAARPNAAVAGPPGEALLHAVAHAADEVAPAEERAPGS